MRANIAGVPRFHAVIASVIAIAGWGCSWGGAAGPVLLAVTPAEAPNHLDVELVLTGRDFEPAVEVDFDRPRSSKVDVGFGVTLVSGATRVALGGVERISSGELHATVAAGTPPGTYDVAVRDPRGRVATLPAAFVLYVQVAVSTAADEADVGATPASPGGTGFSLREAIAWANAQPFPTTITIAAPRTITMVVSQKDLTLSAPGVAVVAQRGVVLDFGDYPQACVRLDGPGQRLSGLTLAGCKNVFVELSSSSGGSRVEQLDFQITGTRYFAYGVWARATSGAPSRIGPGIAFSGLWVGAVVDGDDYEILGNRFQDNGTGVRLAGGSARVWQNVFADQVKGGSNKGLGVDVAAGSGPIEVVQNDFVRNAAAGLQAGAATGLVVRNDLFVGNLGIGLDAAPAGLTHDHNGYYGNANDVAAGLATGGTDVLGDPLFADAAAGDYRLLFGSPAVDKGIDTGLDLNGDAPGRFTGAAPDLGAVESW